MSAPFTLREATREDLSTLLSLIRALAEYEKLSHEVVATESVLGEHLFATPRRAWATLAEVDGKAVGLAIYFYNFSTFLGRSGLYIEDLYVNPSERGKGIGKALLQHVAARAVAEGCGRVEWSVLDWNTPAIEFYESLGAKHRAGWHLYQLTGEALQNAASPAQGKAA